MKEVEKKMMPYGIEYFLRDMGTIVEYYLNNGDQRLDDAYITGVDEEEPVASTVDAYFPQSFKLHTTRAQFDLPYSPEKRQDDEQSKTGRSIASKIVVGIMRRGKTDAFAADAIAQTSSDILYE